MITKRAIQSVVVAALLCLSSVAYAQYEEEPFIEGFVGGNFALPTGHIKNDLEPSSLNAKSGIGLDLGMGYHFKPQIVAGVYFSVRNLGTEDTDLSHRAFELGGFGKFFMANPAEKSLLPYARLSGGICFSKLATEVMDDGKYVLRELSYTPTFGGEAGLGLQWKTNSHGGVYFEVAYHVDFMDGVTGEYESRDYAWEKNNNLIVVKVGVAYNIGRKG